MITIAHPEHSSGELKIKTSSIVVAISAMRVKRNMDRCTKVNKSYRLKWARNGSPGLDRSRYIMPSWILELNDLAILNLDVIPMPPIVSAQSDIWFGRCGLKNF